MPSDVKAELRRLAELQKESNSLLEFWDSAYTKGGRLDAIAVLARLEELEADVQRYKFAPLGDNHHIAAECPYCTPEPKEGATVRIHELEQANERLLKLVDELSQSVVELESTLSDEECAHLETLGLLHKWH